MEQTDEFCRSDKAHEKVALLLDVLTTYRGEFEKGISEYALIGLLKQPPHHIFNDHALRDSNTLFNTHFVLFHALYRLRQQWREADTGELTIHATCIELKPLSGYPRPGHSQHISKADPLAAYYLDWQNFESTGKADVDAMLNDFWRRMTGSKAVADSKEVIEHAHHTLGLQVQGEMTLATLKTYYRRRLLKAHPDKGGSQALARQVIYAYQSLLRYYNF